MATKSFSRTIIIDDPDAINKLQTLKNGKVDEIIYKNRDLISKTIANKTIHHILSKF